MSKSSSHAAALASDGARQSPRGDSEPPADHLVHFEAPNAIARAVLFRDPTTKPLGGPVVEVSAIAKRDLKAGEVLDDYGMYMTYGEAVNSDEMCAGRYLPEGLVQGCRLKRSIREGCDYYLRGCSPACRALGRPPPGGAISRVQGGDVA